MENKTAVRMAVASVGMMVTAFRNARTMRERGDAKAEGYWHGVAVRNGLWAIEEGASGIDIRCLLRDAGFRTHAPLLIGGVS